MRHNIKYAPELTTLGMLLMAADNANWSDTDLASVVKCMTERCRWADLTLDIAFDLLIRAASPRKFTWTDAVYHIVVTVQTVKGV